MEPFDYQSQPKLSDEVSEDFWQVKTFNVTHKQEPLLIDIVTPQPKSQTTFYSRTTSKAKPSTKKSCSRISRSRKTKS